MTCAHKTYRESDLGDRQDVVAGAIASQRLEGLELDAQTFADFEDFTAGRIDLKDVRSRIEARFSGQEASVSFDF